MDRSFLSQPSVIAASRDFVCVRLATYENESEAAFLKSFRVTRSGDLENTVFAIMTPDGSRSLIRASRSARQTFTSATQMAQSMRRIAKSYSPTDRSAPTILPMTANVRLALDVAACDNRPLALVVAREEKTRREIESRLARLAWSDEFIGQFVFASAGSKNDRSAIAGVNSEEGVFVVQPDSFGLKGEVLSRTAANATDAELQECLNDGLKHFRPAQKQHANHVRTGHQRGVFWETVVPVTDPMERQARERGKHLRRD